MKVIGMGDNVVDRYVNRKRMFPGGNAVNFAAYATMCGLHSAYLGNVAGDQQGRLVWDSLASLGVELEMSTFWEGFRTERCDVLIKNGDRVFQESSDNPDFYPPPLILGERELEYLRSFNLIHCGCYARMEGEMKKISALQALRSFDFSEETAFREDSFLEAVCPAIDMALFSGARLDEAAERHLVKKVLKYGVSAILITHGIKGQLLYTADRTFLGKVKIVDSAVDTMGAGDSFFAGFVSTLLLTGWSRNQEPTVEMIEEAFSFAADFSAHICSVEGAYGFGVDYD